MPTPRGGPPSPASGAERGQVLALYLIFLIPISVMVFSVFNVGMLVSEKMKLQNAADAAAYSAATWEARYANLVAYTNRAIVANYETTAAHLALWSMADAWDGFTDAARFRLKPVKPGVDFEQLHKRFHKWNEEVGKQLVGRSRVGGMPATDADGAARLENYSQVLSYAQAALYLVTQLARDSLIREIAQSLDPEIESSSFVDGSNALSLHSRVRWEGTGEEKGLKLLLERSLGELARGESSFRKLAGPAARAVDRALEVGCGELRVSALGFGGPGFEASGGSDRALVGETSLYQHDYVGAWRVAENPIGCPSTDRRQIQVGHNSDDRFNTVYEDRRDFEHQVDARWPYHVGRFLENALGCKADPKRSGKPCATEYLWSTPLSQVSLTTYAESSRVADGRQTEGATVLVTLRKASERQRLLRGLGLQNPEDLEAYAFAKVYYTQRDPRSGDRESLFNPFWAARLESFRPGGMRLLH